MKNFSKVIRQGDVQLVPVKKLPANVKPVAGHILQASEVTGNFHKFKPVKTAQQQPFQIYETGEGHVMARAAENTITPDTGKFVEITETTLLYHGKKDQYVKNPGFDHQALTVFPGLYEVRITREYDPFRNAVRKVVD
jgi:hypothetical protein